MNQGQFLKRFQKGIVLGAVIDHIDEIFESLGEVNCFLLVLLAEVDIDAELVNHLLEARQVLASESLLEEVVVVQERELTHAFGVFEFRHGGIRSDR